MRVYDGERETAVGLSVSRLRELRNVFELKGPYANYRHLALLGDFMMWMTITHPGMDRADTNDVVVRKDYRILAEAATMGVKDDCHWIAENVLFGQMVKMGAAVS